MLDGTQTISQAEISKKNKNVIAGRNFDLNFK
jgi:hypothetical protein